MQICNFRLKAEGDKFLDDKTRKAFRDVPISRPISKRAFLFLSFLRLEFLRPVIKLQNLLEYKLSPMCNLVVG